MKKSFILAASIALTSTSLFAQLSPLHNQQSTILTNNEANQVWSGMKTSFESGSECFNRAMTWTYDINKKYGYEAKKILIHYSLKYNQELSKKIMKAIRGSKIKVQVTQQGQELRVSGNKRDDLQATIQFVKELDLDEPLDYVNFRD